MHKKPALRKNGQRGIFANFDKPMRQVENLFSGLCLGETRNACYGLDRAAFKQKVNAFETLQNAAFFGRCGTSALKTVMLGHECSPLYKINKALY